MKGVKFREYWKKLSADERKLFSEAVGSKVSNMRQLYLTRIPGPKLAMSIHKKTGIPLHDLRSDIWDFPESSKSTTDTD